MLMPSCYHTYEAFHASRYLYVLICIISLIKLLLRFFDLIRVKHIDLYNQWGAECTLKDVKWLYATQINHEIFLTLCAYIWL